MATSTAGRDGGFPYDHSLTLGLLPDDIILAVCAQLHEPRDLAHLSAVCRRFGKIIESDEGGAWRDLCRRRCRFGLAINAGFAPKANQGWRWLCQTKSAALADDDTGTGWAQQDIGWCTITEGNLVDGRLHGDYGVRHQPVQGGVRQVWEGAWVRGQLSGHGCWRDDEGASYVGEWERGMRHGRGCYVWATGASYDGDWHNGFKVGCGRFTWSSGATYDGEWKLNEPDGWGAYVWPSGDRYEGEWRMGDKHGRGTLVRFDTASRPRIADVFVGTWHHDEIACGTHYCARTGNRYEGEFVDGHYHGAGMLTFGVGADSNARVGDTYLGTFAKDCMHGRGTYTHALSGRVVQGEWHCGVLLQPPS